MAFMLTAYDSLATPTVTGPADASRIGQDRAVPLPLSGEHGTVSIPKTEALVDIPKGSENLRFILRAVRIVGMSAFSESDMRDITQEDIGHEITLAQAYRMAGAITERYRARGYFLSRAFIPAQEIDAGVITLRVVEGYVGEVVIEDDISNQPVVARYIKRLKGRKPLKARDLERFLLQLNDLPGYEFSGVLSPMKDESDGCVRLTLQTSKEAGAGSIGFDNASSRFLGPNEASLSYATSLLPLQKTSMSVLSSLPANKLNFATLEHTLPVFPDVNLTFSGSATHAEPGYTLKSLDIESDSAFISAAIGYQLIRQRQENMAFKFSFDARNSTSDIADAPLTRDRIRALRANASYDTSDSWLGYNVVNFTLSEGLDAFGASDKNYIYLSRAEATPDFTKAEMALTRLQRVSDDWSLLLSAAGHYASGPLFSSEEFGYGGQSFGRAYDSSEITGDHGISGSTELRYAGIGNLLPFNTTPYAFYDIGVVWNDDAAQPARESGSSAGFGVRGSSDIGVSGNLGVAWPLTRNIATPIYGQGVEGPRVILQIGQSF